MIESGTLWTSGDGKEFIVLKEIEVDGKNWVYYRDNFNSPPREYSCYKESFVVRFTRLPN